MVIFVSSNSPRPGGTRVCVMDHSCKQFHELLPALHSPLRHPLHSLLHSPLHSPFHSTRSPLIQSLAFGQVERGLLTGPAECAETEIRLTLEAQQHDASYVRCLIILSVVYPVNTLWMRVDYHSRRHSPRVDSHGPPSKSAAGILLGA